MRKLIYLFAYFGSKLRLVWKITLMLPKGCSTGIEVCGGGGSFTLNRYGWFKKAIYNEYNEKIFNLFKLMKDSNTREDLIERLVNIPYDKEVFESAKWHYNNDYKDVEDKLEQAVMTYTLITQSYNNEKKFWAPGKVIGKNQAIRTKRRLEKVGKALENITIMQKDCFNLIEEHGNNRNVFILADVPYPHDTRTSNDSYDEGFEWPNRMHIRFALLARKHNRAKYMICTYDSKIYNKLLVKQAGWTKIKIADLPSPTVNKDGLKNRKEEYIYINYDSYSALAKYFIIL